MDQRAPRTAAFASTIATMSSIALLANAFLGKYPGQEGQRVLLKPLFTGFFSGRERDYWAPTGWSQQEWIWLLITVCLGLIVLWGRSERPVPELPQRRSVEEQIADFESRSTVIGTRQTESVSQTTSSIISSILGDQQTVDSQRVESATTLLSSGDIGTYAASVVTTRNTEIESRTIESEPQPHQEDDEVIENRDFVTDGPAYIPLPDREDHNESPPQLFRDATTEFVTDGPDFVPLPELPDLENDEISGVPSMPSLDDVLESNQRIPELPDLDDLF